MLVQLRACRNDQRYNCILLTCRVSELLQSTAWPHWVSRQVLSSHSIVSSSRAAAWPCSPMVGRWIGHWRTTWSTLCSSRHTYEPQRFRFRSGDIHLRLPWHCLAPLLLPARVCQHASILGRQRMHISRWRWFRLAYLFFNTVGIHKSLNVYWTRCTIYKNWWINNIKYTSKISIFQHSHSKNFIKVEVSRDAEEFLWIFVTKLCNYLITDLQETFQTNTKLCDIAFVKLRVCSIHHAVNSHRYVSIVDKIVLQVRFELTTSAYLRICHISTAR